MRRFLTATLLLSFLLVLVFLLFTPWQSPSKQASSPPETREGSRQPEPAPGRDTAFTPTPPSSRPDLILPPLDDEAHLAKARELEKEGRYLFAVARPTEMAPHLGGRWEIDGDQARWQYHLRSPGAHSLNLAFSEFHLPPSATLTLSDPLAKSAPITFTAQDNDNHGELWTPVFETEELLVTLDLPVALAKDLRLRLAQTNHGFRSKTPGKTNKNTIGNANSGSCNIDVACSAEDDATFGPLVDLFRDQIRSVAAVTLNGTLSCSGALINNTRNDLVPYFLTANHCGINSVNAASVVVYWNFENSTCRTPGSSLSGTRGDGPVTEFNSGSIFRASRAESDFCLIELDDPVDPNFGTFFAGWDRTNDDPAVVVGIHHPGVSEKRICFELDQTTTTAYNRTSPDTGDTHIRVGDWDFGTTEGGSSGSPLFDSSGKIVGQLHGGNAACGNNLADWYGRLSRSWQDGADASSRLSDWLDPDNTGTRSLAGINTKTILSLSQTVLEEGDTGTTSAEITLSLSEPSEFPVFVTLRSQEDTATRNDFSPINQRVTFAPGEISRTFTLAINSDTLPEENESFLLVLSNAFNAAISRTPGRVTILNDDFITPEINRPAAAVALANSPFEYRVTARNTPTSFSIADAPAGMAIDALTGVLTWTPAEPGSESVTVIATNPAGSDSLTLSLTIEPNEIITALELDESSLVINGDPGWTLQTEETFDFLDALRATPIGNGQSASFSLEVTGPDLLEYQYKVSSEDRFDSLKVRIDGSEKASYSGLIDWRRGSLVIPAGVHTVTFSYEKDDSLTAGEDTAWLDLFTFDSSFGIPSLISPSDLIIDAGQDFSYLIESLDPDASIEVSSLPAGLSYDGDRTITGRIVNPGSYSFEIRASADGQEDELLVLLRVAQPIGEAVEIVNLPWTREGTGIWFNQSTVTFDGVDAAQSGAVDDLETSTLSTTVTGPDRLSFRWKVSSEAFYDGLIFLLDGQTLDSVPPISGEQDWTIIDVVIPSGRHVLSWRYTKDGSTASGEDAGWLDDLRFASSFRPMIWSRNQPVFISGIESRFPLEFINAESFSFEGLPNWLEYREETSELVGIPPAPGNVELAVTATGNGETLSRSFALAVRASSSELTTALGQTDLAIATAGDVPWSSESEPTGARSGAISDNQSSSLVVSLQGPGSLRFRWMVSSESGYDILRYTLNGTVMNKISGEVDWEEIEVPLLPGRNQIVWTYQKDESAAGGDDLGRVADLRLGGYAHFLSEEGIDHYTSTPSDDPEGNGLSLFHEFAFGIAPGSPGPPQLLQISPLPDQPGEAVLEFDGLLPGSGIDYLLESASNPDAQRWDRLTGDLEAIPGNGNAHYRFTTPIPRAGQPSLFFRLRTRFSR